jgi:hypothetical protein
MSDHPVTRGSTLTGWASALVLIAERGAVYMSASHPPGPATAPSAIASIVCRCVCVCVRLVRVSAFWEPSVSQTDSAGKDRVDNKNAALFHFLIECGLPDREGGNLRGCRLAQLLLGGDNERRRSSSPPRDPWSQSGAVVGGAKPVLDVRETRNLQKTNKRM